MVHEKELAKMWLWFVLYVNLLFQIGEKELGEYYD